MKLLLFNVLVLCFFNFSQAQSDLPMGSKHTNEIITFRNECEGMVGDVVPIDLQIVIYKTTRKTIMLEFLVAANCAKTNKGDLLFKNDSLFIYNNEYMLSSQNTYTDSLGVIYEEETFTSSVAFCNCNFRYRYKIRNVFKPVNVFCYDGVLPLFTNLDHTSSAFLE